MGKPLKEAMGEVKRCAEGIGSEGGQETFDGYLQALLVTQLD
jgi:hypothetical protein